MTTTDFIKLLTENDREGDIRMIEEKYEDVTISPFFKKPVGTLKINESFSISIYGKMPCHFHRWMARALLGWKYKKTEDGCT